MSEVFGDVGVVEVVHLVHHADGGIDNGESAESTSTFAKTEAKMEQGLGIYDIKHHLMAAFIATMGENHIVLRGWIKSDGS